GIRRYSGIRSDTTVRAVLSRFERMHILNTRRSTADGGLRACNSYELTMDDPQLLQLMTEIYDWEQNEIALERETRREQRKARQRFVREGKSCQNLASEEQEEQLPPSP